MRGGIRASAVYCTQGSRPSQEDHVLVQEEKGIFVVADGFGGPVSGLEAAKTSCESVRKFLFKEAGDRDATLPFEIRSYFSLVGNVLFNSLIHANRKVFALNKGKGIHEKGGSSVLAGYLDGSLLALANVGACSAWMIRGGSATELVTPRSYGRLVDCFVRDIPSEMRVPLMALGMSQDLEPEIYECQVLPGDWLLVATGGCTEDIRQAIGGMQVPGIAPASSAKQVSDWLKLQDYQDNSSFLLLIF